MSSTDLESLSIDELKEKQKKLSTTLLIIGGIFAFIAVAMLVVILRGSSQQNPLLPLMAVALGGISVSRLIGQRKAITQELEKRETQ